MSKEQLSHVYELVDASDKESYETLGMWLSKEDALRELEEIVNPEDMGSPLEHDEMFRVELHAHPLGWNTEFNLVAVKLWRTHYDEFKHEFVWREVKTMP